MIWNSDDEPDPPHGDRRPVAYMNDQFLNSPDARALRILSEFLEPLAHFRREKIRDTVVFFGSARIREEGPMSQYYQDARTLSRMLTEWSGQFANSHHRFVICSGGGPGIMEAANRGAHEGRREDRGAEYRAALRTVSQPLYHAGIELRIPLLLHAEVLVCVPCQGAGGFPGGFGRSTK